VGEGGGVILAHNNQTVGWLGMVHVTFSVWVLGSEWEREWTVRSCACVRLSMCAKMCAHAFSLFFWHSLTVAPITRRGYLKVAAV